MASRNIKLVLEYDGTAYCGWQTQANGPTVQETLENSIEAVVGSPIKLHGSGRTDAGVHALGQVASFETDSRIPCGQLCQAINAHLPEDISVLHAEDEDPGFHARYSARSKIYRYVILNRPSRTALERHRCFFVRDQIDVGRMREAAPLLVGRHDFSAFCAETPENATREVLRLDVTRLEEIIGIEVEANGFLYNMVRRITGALLEVGRGKLSVDDIRQLIDTGEGVGGPTLPAHALYLVDVRY
jgi:tRNA pseudouridine38-40 synthase